MQIMRDRLTTLRFGSINCNDCCDATDHNTADFAESVLREREIETSEEKIPNLFS